MYRFFGNQNQKEGGYQMMVLEYSFGNNLFGIMERLSNDFHKNRFWFPKLMGIILWKWFWF